MNKLLLARFLGLISLLLGGSMAFSLPWALPPLSGGEFETRGFFGLLASMVVCFALGGTLKYLGRGPRTRLFRKEAMAIVGLSWLLATVLGALPYLFSGTMYDAEHRVTVADAIFESQSGFSTTGATILTNLDDPELVPHCILFWRSSTHFLGGLGIVVLFVAILGQGSAGKAMMRAEVPGPSFESHQARVQHTAWMLCVIYLSLNAILTVLLWMEGLTVFDALCHAFGTMATGGFSTHNASAGWFATQPGLNGPLIEMTLTFFMVLAGTNFVLIYFVALGQPGRLFADIEWRIYIGFMVVVTILVVSFGLYRSDFPTLLDAIRFGLFQVVSIMTTTGYGTHDFDEWNSYGRGVLFLLMFVGGCAGSTGGGLKVIRHVLLLKVLLLQIEQAFRPSVVRPVRLSGHSLPEELRTSIPMYFAAILVIFVFSWMAVVTFEPDATWTGQGRPIEDKLIDSASGVAATLNNIGPGLGTVGATQNYAHFSQLSKLLFTFLMMVGRLEVYVILVLFVPAFWRSR